MPSRTFKPRTRRSATRDARLIIIAAEGTKTEKRYFEDLAAYPRYRNPKVHVEVLERESNASSPSHVIRMLDDFKATYRLNQYDELWLVIDVDRWPTDQLSAIAAQCQQKTYQLAVSNPCFELWLLLHLTGLENYTLAERTVLLTNKKSPSGRTRLEQELVRLLGSYNKSEPNTEKIVEDVEVAIVRASDLEDNPQHRWTNGLGTRVYLVARSIIRTTHRLA